MFFIVSSSIIHLVIFIPIFLYKTWKIFKTIYKNIIILTLTMICKIYISIIWKSPKTLFWSNIHKKNPSNSPEIEIRIKFFLVCGHSVIFFHLHSRTFPTEFIKTSVENKLKMVVKISLLRSFGETNY